jgi:putative transposase
MASSIKRHLIVDSLGLVLKVVVTEANARERLVAAYALMLLKEEYAASLKRVKVLWEILSNLVYG